mmetsp:Transcript_86016/g.179872  ORF Transcript_86016/g.179872 Transcript_86016/m.179872 type:complete len:116 (+) Transcript_86016:177-524(+)
MVKRNENIPKWDRYLRTRSKIQAECTGCELHTAKTQTEVGQSPDMLKFLNRSDLDETCNEFYLFHGTNPSAAKAICENSFLMDRAGTNAGTLYGPGLYFAEDSMLFLFAESCVAT